MNRFELLSAPLEGTHLIEAGAGTGKTYSIASIFLRLVLERELTVDQILVLTYTRAATLELKERVRTKLAAMKQVLADGDHQEDVLYKHLLAQAQSASLVTKWSLLLEGALADFDNANIYNFHQFCQKIIKNYAVETGGSFDAEILPDNTALLEQAALDFWRKTVYPAEPLLAGYLADNLKTAMLISLVKEVTGFSTTTDLPELLPAPEIFDPAKLAAAIKSIDGLFREMRNTWLLERGTIVTTLLSAPLHQQSYKPSLIQGMAQGMDSFTDGFLPYPLPSNLDKWGADCLRRKTRKGCNAPAHAFFQLCENMTQAYATFETEAQNYIQNLKIEAVSYINSAMSEQKMRQNKLDFNDLIQMVGQALLKDQNGTLSRQLKNSFKGVMVDEFQDTDALQYAMFASLFANSEHLFFMIGDPKQAIYAFRGADIFSYFMAAKSTRSAFSLTTNWRSVPNLVYAVNHVFKNHPLAPFVVDEIRFSEAVVNPLAAENRFKDAPLVFWYLDSRRTELGGEAVVKGGKSVDHKLTDSKASSAAARAVAQEILRLLNDTAQALKPKDIAVLVNSHHQGRLIYRALEDCGIPATLNANESVYQTDEARELLLILESAARPDSLPKLKAAFTTSVLGGVADEYLPVNRNEEIWLQRLQKMQRWHQTFQERGFLSMFLNMVFDENSFGRLLSAVNGRRKVTNFMHLAELLHASAQTLNLTLTGIIRFLRTSMRASAVNDETALRLETDSDVVQIVTVHKSKGLEYEVVFYPFAWEGVRNRGMEVYKYHQQNEIKLGFNAETAEFKQFLTESLAEKLRLLYVALTRAKQRCYVAYGRVKAGGNSKQDKFETAALTYLLLGQNYCGNQAGLTDLMKSEFNKPEYDDDRLRSALEKLAQNAQNRIQVLDLPVSVAKERYKAPALAATALKTVKRTLNTNWKVASFSSLTTISSITDDLFEGRDLEQNINNIDAEAEIEAVPSANFTEKPFSIFDLPKGAHVGNFFHDLLENTDFAVASQKPDLSQVTAKLLEYNLSADFAPAVCRLLFNLCNADLSGNGRQICLKRVRKLLKEMEFYFPLKPVTQEGLRDLFSQNTTFELPDSFAEQSAKFVFAPAAGYLKGFVDLIFCLDDRYYILDWKSNYEGASVNDYQAAKLEHSVAAHSYFLQYYLYSLALCQYLRLKLADFSYAKDFGGVFYIYLRGFAVQPNPNADQGVFRDRPPLGLINALGRLLIPAFEDFKE